MSMTTEEPDSSANATKSKYSDQQLKLLAAFVVILQYLARYRNDLIVPAGKKAAYLRGAVKIAEHFKSSSSSFNHPDDYIEEFLEEMHCDEAFFNALCRNAQQRVIWDILNAIIMSDPSKEMLRKTVITTGLFGHERGQLCYWMGVVMAGLD